MATTDKAPVLVVLQLSGGNDSTNTVVPYNDPLYRDYRPQVGLPEEQILPLDGEVGLHPQHGTLACPVSAGPAGDHPWEWAIRTRCAPHFRSWTFWHTCEPDKTGTEAG